MWCRRGRPRRRKPPGLEKVPATWWCRTRHLTSPQRPPLVKTRRRNKEALPPSEGSKEEEGRPNRGGRGVEEKENPSAGLLPRRRRGRRGVAGPNQASNDIVSVYIPE